MTKSAPFKKVFCLGLDGATFDLIDLFIDRGHLPNLKKLIRTSTRSKLKSVILPFTPQAWSSFMTGVNPGKHGIFGFKVKEDNNYAFQFVNNKTLKTKSLWKILSENGKKVILVNIPMTYPPEEVNGILVGGMDSPGLDSDFTYPSHIKKEIKQITGDYVVHLHIGAGFLDNDKKRMGAARELIRMVNAREKVVIRFMEDYDWDFFAVNFAATDQVQHHFWKYLNGENRFKNTILDIYKRVDEVVGNIKERLDDDVLLLVMSDHGAGPASNLVFFIDELLREKGLLSFNNMSTATRFKRYVKDFGLRFLSKKLSSKVKDKLMRAFPGARAKTQGYIRRALINWQATKVFSGEHPMTLRINLKGRDVAGIVESSDYEPLRDYLVSLLESLEIPDTKERLIDKVYRKEEIYHGDYLESAPDLIICPVEYTHQIKGGPYSSKTYHQPICKKDPNEFFVNGTHRLDGIFIANGDNIKPDFSLHSAGIMDLFPTTLYALGLPIPESIDGKVITDIFCEDFLATNPVRYSSYNISRDGLQTFTGQTYLEEDTKEIEESLRGLGYID